MEKIPFPEAGFQEKKQGLEILAGASYRDEIVKSAIWHLKYRGVRKLAEPLAKLILRRMQKEWPLSENKIPYSDCLIIPIPLSKKRFRQRGYNQSELIAKCLSDKLSVRISADNLIKIKNTPSQVEIKDREKRIKNLEGSFGLANPESVKNKTIILIDDVSTTGATMKEASKILKSAGAKKVIGLVVAR